MNISKYILDNLNNITYNGLNCYELQLPNNPKLHLNKIHFWIKNLNDGMIEPHTHQGNLQSLTLYGEMKYQHFNEQLKLIEEIKTIKGETYNLNNLKIYHHVETITDLSITVVKEEKTQNPGISDFKLIQDSLRFITYENVKTELTKLKETLYSILTNSNNMEGDIHDKKTREEAPNNEADTVEKPSEFIYW